MVREKKCLGNIHYELSHKRIRNKFRKALRCYYCSTNELDKIFSRRIMSGKMFKDNQEVLYV
jgi:hypothetical protein